MLKLDPRFWGKGFRFILGAGIGTLPLLMLVGTGGAVSRRPPAFDYNAPPHLMNRHVFRIVAYGSSSTLGIGASSPNNAYPARLERLLNGVPGGTEPVDVVNRGIGGEDLPTMMRRLQSDILSRKPQLVIWQTGSNDVLHGLPLQVFEDDLREGIAAIRETGAEVMVMDPQWCPKIEGIGSIGRYIGVIHRLAKELKVSVIPRFELMRQWMATGLASERELIGPDHLHSTDRGYDLLAQAVFNQVVQDSDAYRSAVHGGLSAVGEGSMTLR